MKAIRDEYLKLPGIKFGWVTGKRATAIRSQYRVLHLVKDNILLILE